MKESHVEGVADHNGPESGVGARKGIDEAMTGENTGRVLSREKGKSRVPTLSTKAEGNAGMSEKGEHMSDPARSETPCMYGNSMRENRESLCLFSGYGGTHREGGVHNPVMHGGRQSDSSIVCVAAWLSGGFKSH